jgi:hypothetical protein
MYDELAQKWLDGVGLDPEVDDPTPTPAIRAYVEALLDRWPDITEDDDSRSPWADGPVISNASGPFFYFGFVWSRADDACTTAAQVAAEYGLVCFDPQSGVLRAR